MIIFIKKYVLWTYLVFYGFLLLIGFTMQVLKYQVPAEVLKVISSWTATFVFIAMFRKVYPKEGIGDYVRRLFGEKIKITVVLCVVSLQTSIFLGVLLATCAIEKVPVSTKLNTSLAALALLFFDTLIRGPLGEELGWRGFVLNELQKKFSPLKSAMIVGVAWGFWHAPLWLLSGYSGMQLILYVICFMTYIIALSIIMTAFYNWNRNIVIPIIIHQLVNYYFVIQTGDILQVFIKTAPIYFLTAVSIILVDYKQWLSLNALGTPLIENGRNDVND